MPPSYSSLSASISQRGAAAPIAVVCSIERADRDLLEAVVAPDAVALVDQVVAGRELREVADAAEQRVLRALLLALRVVGALAEHVGRGDQRDAVARATRSRAPARR